MTPKPVLALDLDGVLHPNVSPWRNVYTLPDSPTTGAQDFVHLIQASGWRVEVHTARCNAPNADESIREWLRDWGFPDMHVSHVKRNASVYLDDRGLRFTGSWPTLVELERAGVPWNRTA